MSLLKQFLLCQIYLLSHFLAGINILEVSLDINVLIYSCAFVPHEGTHARTPQMIRAEPKCPHLSFTPDGLCSICLCPPNAFSATHTASDPVVII